MSKKPQLELHEYIILLVSGFLPLALLRIPSNRNSELLSCSDFDVSGSWVFYLSLLESPHVVSINARKQ